MSDLRHRSPDFSPAHGHAVQPSACSAIGLELADSQHSEVMAYSCRYCAVMRLSRRATLLVLLGVLLLVLLLAVPAPWLAPDRYQAYTSGVQAVGVLATLLIAMVTLRGDSRDRRVDRVLALHYELTSGETGIARRRLGAHFRRNGTKPWVLQTTIDQLADSKSRLSKYQDASIKHRWVSRQPASPQQTPRDDAGLLLRFFERAWLAQTTGSLDDSMCASLIGRHAGWWDRALLPSPGPPRAALAELAAWANKFAESHASESQFADWGKSRQKDFPPLA
jgi:hypothetical protein